MTFDQIITTYATAKICGVNVSISEIEELYPKYLQEAREEYNKLHGQDESNKSEAILRPY